MTCPAAPTCPHYKDKAGCGWMHYQGKDATGNLIDPLWENYPHRKERKE